MKPDKEVLTSDTAKRDRKALARAITIVENELSGYENILLNLESKRYVPVIGITGPPGAGKSTLVNCLIHALLQNSANRIGVISVDPSSPLHRGAILGDRLRMNEHFNNEQVFIRSLATRGASGGLSAKTIEITELMRCSGFDYLLIETAGVGQTEVEIAGLADVTLLILSPESGDEIQAMKSGVMEIADIWIVNKSDREGADEFVKNLYNALSLQSGKNKETVIVKTIATRNEGTDKLLEIILRHIQQRGKSDATALWAEKAYRLILKKRMKDISKEKLRLEIENELKSEHNFNIYHFVTQY